MANSLLIGVDVDIAKAQESVDRIVKKFDALEYSLKKQEREFAKFQKAQETLAKTYDRIDSAQAANIRSTVALRAERMKLREAFYAGNLTFSEYTKGLNNLNAAQNRAAQTTAALGKASAKANLQLAASNGKLTSSFGNMRGAAQNFGYQLQDIAVQAQMGVDPLRILTQQGSQMAMVFGPGGALIGAALAIGGALVGAMIPSLMETSKSMEELEAEAAELDATLRKLTNNFTNVGGSLRGALTNKLNAEIGQATGALTKAGKEYANALRDAQFAIRSAGSLEAALAAPAVDNDPVDRLRKAVIDLELARFKVEELQQRVDDLQRTSRGLFTDDEAQKKLADITKKVANDGLSEVEKLRAAMSQMVDGPLKDQYESQLEILEARERELDLVKKLEAGEQRQAQQNAKLANQRRRDAAALARITAVSDPLGSYKSKLREITRLRDVYKDNAEALGKLAIAEQQVLEAMDKAEMKTLKAENALSAYAKTAIDLQDALEDGALKGVKSLEDGLVDLITGAESASDAFSNMARSIINDIARMHIQQSVTKPLAGMLSSFIPSFFGFGDAAKNTRAEGGPISAGHPYLVGERGPELIIPNASGTVIPNKMLGGGGSGVTVNQTINLSTGVQQTVRTEVMSMLPQIAEASKSAVLDARRRGGSFARGFGV